MLKILVSYMLGPWGLKILYFYLQYAAIINSVVFLYGLFLVTAHYNYSKIYNNLQDQMLNQNTSNKKKKSVNIQLEKAINSCKMFPFISGQLSLIVKKTNRENFTHYLLRDKEWLKLTEGIEIIFS